MCGIGGYYSLKKLSEKAQLNAADQFAEMMLALQDRGTDACGMFTVGSSSKVVGSPNTYRRPGPAKDHIDDLWELACNAGPTPLVIGHTRRATGANPKRNRNNHPFVADHITGVHNGVFRDYRLVAASDGLKMSGDCDSETIFRMLAQFTDAEDYVASLATRLNEYNRVVFFDDRTRLLHLYTQDDCGLCYSIDKRSGVAWIATAPEFLPNHARGDFKWLEQGNLYNVRNWDKVAQPKTRAKKATPKREKVTA